MTKTELNKNRNVLEAKQAELARMVRNRDGIAIEANPDALDAVQHATERELAIRHLDRDFTLLRNIRSALGRLDDGSFGVCLDCDEDVSPKRLAALPWAAFCIHCQEIADRNQGEIAEDAGRFLINAA